MPTVRQCDVPPETWAKLMAAAAEHGVGVRPSCVTPGPFPGMVVNPAFAPPALDCPEKEFQLAVQRLAEANGWLFFHPYDSRKSAGVGYPDCTMLRVGADGRGELVFAELKATTGTFTPEQRIWLGALETVPAVKVFRWRPADWASEIVPTLTAPRA